MAPTVFRRRLRRGPRERGASLVEFALVAPVFFALLFAIVDFGFAFNDWTSVRQGVREGARQISVGNTGDDASCPLTGVNPNTETHEAMCYVKDRVGLLGDDTRVKIVVSDYVSGAEMLVCVMYPLETITGIYDPVMGSAVFTSSAELRVEELASDDGVIENAEETPLSGGNWSFCAL